MPQIKEDKFIAEAYANIEEIALKPTESIDDIKKRYFKPSFLFFLFVY